MQTPQMGSTPANIHVLVLVLNSTRSWVSPSGMFFTGDGCGLELQDHGRQEGMCQRSVFGLFLFAMHSFATHPPKSDLSLQSKL